MDMRSSWLQEDQESGWVDQNVVVFSDGGVQNDQEAAAAWSVGLIFGLHSSEMEFHLIAARGIFINYPISSFLAEAIALDGALSYFKSAINGFRKSRAAPTDDLK